MIAIDFEDETLVRRFADFLRFKLPGETTASGRRLVVTVEGTLDPAAERRVLERLLWAWQVEQGVDPPARVSFPSCARTEARTEGGRAACASSADPEVSLL